MWFDEPTPDEAPLIARNVPGHTDMLSWFSPSVEEDPDQIRCWLDDVETRSEGPLWLPKVEKADTEGSTLFVASTSDSDRMGDVIEQGTWRLKNFRRNPVILHEHGGGMCANTTVVGRGVARITDPTKADGDQRRLEIRVFWDDHETNRLGQLMAHQHRNGFRHAGSVGFRPGKSISRRDLPDDHPAKVGKDGSGRFFRHNELLEFSSVAIPANPQALQLNSLLTGIEDPDAAIRRFVGETVHKDLGGAILHEVKHNAALRAAITHLIWGSKSPEDNTKGATLWGLEAR